jgi:hypothetical protein
MITNKTYEELNKRINNNYCLSTLNKTTREGLYCILFYLCKMPYIIMKKKYTTREQLINIIREIRFKQLERYKKAYTTQ